MGVALRYWLRWTIEGDYSSLPAVLTSGDGRGIQSMEFPLYNLLFSPAFLNGVEVGRPLAQILSFAVMSALTFIAFKLWRGRTIAGIKVDLAFALLFLTGVSSKFFFRFMPDYLAFILVMISMGLLLRPSLTSQILSFFLLSLGLLVKPPTIVALGPLLIVQNRKQLLKTIIAIIIPAGIICVLYYTAGIQFIRSLSDQPEYFLTNPRNPATALIDFFSHPRDIIELFLKNLFGHLLIIPLLVDAVFRFLKRDKMEISSLFLILLLQIIAVAALDGSHAFIHDYYFIGTSFVVGLIIAKFLESAMKPSLILFGLILAFGTIEKMIYEIRPIWTKNNWRYCGILKDRHPEFPWDKGYVFRSPPGPIPHLGLCFGERQASETSNYGFFAKGNTIPEDCSLVDQESEVSLVTCKGKREL